MYREREQSAKSPLAITDLRPVATVFQDRDAGHLLGRYGMCQSYEIPTGETITVFSTCSVPIPHLIRENWDRKTAMGHFRGVYSVDSLSDGVKPDIVVKSPERTFTKDDRLLENGYLWWGGSRSAQRRTTIIGNPVVEVQALWEAIILLELHHNGVRAEVPQALIRGGDGSCELVVNEIGQPGGFASSTDVIPSRGEIQAMGLQPEDWPGTNILRDDEGISWTIDVNRWSWPPYTNDHRRRLLQEIQKSKVS